MAPSRHDWKIVDWDVKPQHNQPTTKFSTNLLESFSSGEYLTIYSPESIHIWNKGTLEGLPWVLTPGFIPRDGAGGQNLGHL